MGTFFQNIVGWQFLSEPAWRWAIFVAMITFFLFAQKGILRHM